MRRRTRLGAITGERLEYRLPASVFLALTKGQSQAVCFDNAEGLLLLARTKAGREQRASDFEKAYAGKIDPAAMSELNVAMGADRVIAAKKRLEKRAATKGKKAGSLTALVETMTKELYRLRAKGVKGKIPVCLYRSSGKVAEFPREQRRSTAQHERFHADVRRAEERLGARLDEANCNLQAREALAQVGPATKAALRFSRLAQWGTPLEELLARTEEIRKSCLKGEKSCEETKGRFRKTVLNYASRVDSTLADNPGLLADAEAEIRARYGSAMGFVTQALRNPTCKVRR